eukprot:UN29245
MKKGECIATFKGHTAKVWCCFTTNKKDGKYLFTCSNDHSMKQWSIKTLKCLRTFKEHNSSVWGCTSSLSERTALSIIENGYIKVWKTYQISPEERGNLRFQIDSVHSGGIYYCLLLGTWIFTTGYDGTVKIYN